jgi:hypothetical protein
MDKQKLLDKIANESIINFNDIPENLLTEPEVLNAIKNNFSELFNQDEFMKLFYAHLKNEVGSIDEDYFMLLTETYQSDKAILLKCNPDFWDWSEEAIDQYKSIVKKYYSKDVDFILSGLKENGCDSSFLILADESLLKNEEVMLESIKADVRKGMAPSLLADKELLNSVDFLKKVIAISNDYLDEIFDNEEIADEVKASLKY